MGKRTTITLDDDVAAKLEQESRRRRESFRRILNEAIRRGLAPPPRKGRIEFRINPRDLGLRAGYELDDVEELLDQADGEWRR